MNTRIIHLLMTGLILTACSEEILRSNSSPSFADGYQDGCKSGSSTASNLTGQFVRNETRYANDPEYASGWRNGDRECDGQHFNVNPTNPMEPVDIDGPH